MNDGLPLPPLAPTPPHAPRFTRVHLWLYRSSGGKIGGRILAHQFLMLTTIGRKSGRRYTVPLEYYTDGHLPYIIGSNYGKNHPPSWYFNLQANPLAEIERNGARHLVTARVADAQMRQRIWPELVRVAPYYGRYQQHISREIPLVLLHPVE
jgi:deazaflavin-dependent oxidoreductase (nitroreductase family)